MSVHWISVSKVAKQDKETIRQWKQSRAFQGGQPVATKSSQSVSDASSPESSEVGPSSNTSNASTKHDTITKQQPVPNTPLPPANAKQPPAKQLTQESPQQSRDPFLRTFFVVNSQGNKVVLDHGVKPPKLTLRGGARATLADVAKKAIHHSLKHKEGSQPQPHTQPPPSVQAAVQRAVAQNFMCSCPGAVCTNRLRCNEASEAQAKAYLQKYAHDAATLHTEPVTIYLAEHTKPGVREFSGGYRLVQEPSRDFIRQGYTTSVDATYIRTLHLTHVPQ